MAEQWISEWDEAIEAIGQDFSDGEKHIAADVVELGAIRRYCEPLEFDCPIHYDEATARGASAMV